LVAEMSGVEPTAARLRKHKKSPAFFGTPRLIIVFKNRYHCQQQTTTDITANNKQQRPPLTTNHDTSPTTLYLNAADQLPNPKRCWLVCVRAFDSPAGCAHLPEALAACLQCITLERLHKKTKVQCCVLCLYKGVTGFS
jgi:hypothetical protein